MRKAQKEPFPTSQHSVALEKRRFCLPFGDFFGFQARAQKESGCRLGRAAIGASGPWNLPFSPSQGVDGLIPNSSHRKSIHLIIKLSDVAEASSLVLNQGKKTPTS